MSRRVPLVIALPLLVAACASKSSAPPPPPTTGPPPPPPPLPTEPTKTTTTSGDIVLSVYFLRDGKVAAARRVVPATQQVGGAALNELVEGPTAAERRAGLRTAVSEVTSFDNLSIRNGVARVEPDRDLGARAMAQVNFTLTQFPTVRSVRAVFKEPPDSVGVTVGTRADFEDLTPAILVESPVVGESLSSPLRIRGTANTFEATFQVELRAGGRRLTKQTVTATSGSGTRGTFDTGLYFRVAKAMPGLLLAYELSAAGGRPIHVVRIPLRLEPA